MSSDTRSALVGFAFGFGAAIAAVVLASPKRKKRRLLDDDRPIIRVRNRRLEVIGDDVWVDRQSHWRLEDERAARTDHFDVRIFLPDGEPAYLAGQHVFIECRKERGGMQQFQLHALPEEANKRPKLTPVSPLKHRQGEPNVLVPDEPMRIQAVRVPGCPLRTFPEGVDVDIEIYPIPLASWRAHDAGSRLRGEVDPRIPR